MIEEYFTSGYDYVILPIGVKDVPITMSKMLMEDGITYHTINTLEATLGHLFVPTAIIDSRFMAIHYGFDRNGEEGMFKTFLTSMGLVDMRTNLGAVDSIDFTKLTGMEYGIFSALEVQSVPVIKEVV